MKRSSAIAMLMAAAATAAACASSAPQQTGTFALLDGNPQIVSKFWATHGTGSNYTLHVQQFDKSGAPIKTYEIDMQHYMHVVIVRDDFGTFAHQHPSYNPGTGTFETPFTKQPNHRYNVYADSMPKGIGQQVFRFTLESDGPYAMYKLSTAASSYNAKAGPYNVLLAKTTFARNVPHDVDLTIVQGDDPADDLAPYLGAPAHVVMIDMSTLEYIHVHPRLKGDPMPMNGGTMPMSGKAGPFMKLSLPPLPAGAYKTWVQFAGGKNPQVYTAPFTVVVR